MMGRLKSDQGQLFYEFRLGDAVPEDHLVRKIDTALDLSWLRSELEPHYSSMGRPSIDPELMIRMLVVGYVFAIRSERLICREVQVNLAYSPMKVIGYMFTVRLLQQAMEINTQSRTSSERCCSDPAICSSDQTVRQTHGQKHGNRFDWQEHRRTNTYSSPEQSADFTVDSERWRTRWTTYWRSERDSNRGALVRDFGNLFLVGSSTIGVETRSRRSNRPRPS
jgi:hypothetical protein